MFTYYWVSPVVKDARIKRHNKLCGILADEAKKKEWLVFQEPLLRDKQKELYKPDLIFVKAFVVDITVRYQSKPTTLVDAAAEGIKKYQHLKDQIHDLTNSTNIKFLGFPLGTHSKWHQGNYELLTELSLPSSQQEKVVHHLSNQALFT